jgi:hypothetical protein
MALEFRTLNDFMKAIDWQDADIYDLEEIELHNNLGETGIAETYDATKQYPNHFSLKNRGSYYDDM